MGPRKKQAAEQTAVHLDSYKRYIAQTPNATADEAAADMITDLLNAVRLAHPRRSPRAHKLAGLKIIQQALMHYAGDCDVTDEMEAAGDIGPPVKVNLFVVTSHEYWNAEAGEKPWVVPRR